MLQVSFNRTSPGGSVTVFLRGRRRYLLALAVATVGVTWPRSAQAQGAGLAAAYAMDDASGTSVSDSSGNGNTGTLTNAPTWTTGKNGGALLFDGVDDLVRVNDSNSLDFTTGATFEAWVHPTVALAGWVTIMQKEVDAWFFTASGGGPGNRPTSGGTFGGVCCTVVEATAALPVNTWSHVAATYDGAQLRFYTNGTLVASVPVTGSYQVNANPLWIGGNAVYGEHFKGKLDDLRLYNRALTQAEIQTDMNTPVGGTPPPDTTPPSIPTGLSATPVSPTQINLTWTASTDNVAVTGYHVFRGGVQVATATATSYPDTGLTASTLYSYVVRAVDAAGNVSALSASVSATTPAIPLPDTTLPVVSLTAPAANSTLVGSVTVSASASDNVGVVGVQFLLDGASLGAEDTTSPYGVSWNTTTASNGSHALSARARDAVGNIGTAAAITVVVDNQPPSGAVTINGGAAATNNRAVILTLSATDALSTVTQMRFSNTGTSYSAAEAYATTRTWTLTTGAGTKTVHAQFKDAVGNWSAAATDTVVLDRTAPTISAVVAAGVTAGSAIITWTTNEPASSQVNYGLTTSYGSTTVLDPTLRTSHTVTITGLASQRLYNYRPRSRDAAGNERVGTNKTFTTLAGPDTIPPSVPSNLSTTPVSSSEINVAWTASTDNVGVTGYRVERCQGAGCSNFAQVATPSATSYKDIGLQASSSYSYRVRATDAAGNLSGYSATASASTPVLDTQPPTAPTNLMATAVASTQINLAWTASTDDVGVTGYRVERCQGSGCSNFAQVATPSGASYNDTGLQASTRYSYQVRATDAAGNLSGYSTTASATTPAAPTTITFKQSNYKVPQTPQTSVTVTYTAAQTAGNLNVVVVGWNDATSQVLSVSDTRGNVYVPVIGPTVQPGTHSQSIYAAASIAAAAANTNTATVTFNGAVSFPDVRIAEYQGIDPVNPVDVAAGAYGTGSVSNSGTVTTTSTSALLLAANYVQTVTTGPGTGFTSRLITSPNGSILEDRVVTAPGTYGATATLSGSGGWVMQIVAFRAAGGGGDAEPPTAPTDLMATAVSSSQINLTWTASTDNVGVVGYRVERCQGAGCSNFAPLATPSGTSYTDTDLLGSTTYSYRVRAFDTVNFGPYSAVAAATTAPTPLPTITIVTPPAARVLTGTVTLTAIVTGSVGGVQFQVDGVNVGPAVTAAPYSISFSTPQFPNGSHAIGAYTWDSQRNVVFAAPVQVTFSNTSPGSPAQSGLWSPLFTWPLVAVHVNLLKDGRVLAWDKMDAGNHHPQLWDPVTSAFTPVPTNDSANLFCAGHLTLPDGRLLSAGGHADNHVGLSVARIFDPVTKLWTSSGDMTYPRWYPTLTTLPDGRVLVLSGEMNCGFCYAEVPEVYNPATGTWTPLAGAPLSMPWYPHAFVLPDGRVLVAGTTEAAVPARVLNTATQTWSVVDARIFDGHTSAMYLPGKVLKSGTATSSGGDDPSAATAYVLDMTVPSPAWRQVASMAFPRAYHVETLLPDGTVLVTGGGRTTLDYGIANAVYAAEIWSPLTETWTTMSAAQAPRLYHASALLLPDGRVLVAGGGRSPGPDPRDQENAEIFAPPYLFKGPRPRIDSAPAQLSYGQSFTVQTPDGARIAKVALVALGAMTHGFNMSQRYASMAFTVAPGGLTVTAPANANLAPPGQYMLFLVDDAGVPSMAWFVQF